MTETKLSDEKLKEKLQKIAWERIEEALMTKKVELPARPGSPAQTVPFSPSDYLKLAQWVANYKEGGSNRQNPPLNPDVFQLPKTK